MVSAVSDHLWAFWVFFLDCSFVLTSKSDTWTRYLPRTRCCLIFWKKIHQMIHGSVRGYDTGLRDLFLGLISMIFGYIWLFRWFPSVSSEFGRVWVNAEWFWDVDWFFRWILTMYRLSINPIRKWSHLMNLDHGLILIHRTRFLSDSVSRGLDLRLRDIIRPFAIIKYRILSQKIILMDDLRVEDHARVLYFWGHGGTLRTKIALKWSLEALIVTRNTRIARGRSRNRI